MNKKKFLLLDTHIWIWLCNGDEKLKNTALLSTIEMAAKENSLLLSIISIWEFGMLIKKKRLSITMSSQEWIQAAIEQSGVTIVELSPQIALLSCSLPGNFHGDPADRIIVAATLLSQATLATQDKNILQYSAEESIPTLSF